MQRYLQFLAMGLVLGLFTEFQLKLVAGINPPAFLIALGAYPVILTLSYAAGAVIDRVLSATWTGDLLHYLFIGVGGLAIEWTLLGNGPDSNALQSGMFAMWTTFGFGPRVLSRPSLRIARGQRRFWVAFGVAALLLTACVWLATGPKAKIVIAVFGLSATYGVWSVVLLVLAWKSHRVA